VFVSGVSAVAASHRLSRTSNRYIVGVFCVPSVTQRVSPVSARNMLSVIASRTGRLSVTSSISVSASHPCSIAALKLCLNKGLCCLLHALARRRHKIQHQTSIATGDAAVCNLTLAFRHHLVADSNLGIELSQLAVTKSAQLSLRISTNREWVHLASRGVVVHGLLNAHLAQLRILSCAEDAKRNFMRERRR
jgi:hypothetical protein